MSIYGAAHAGSPNLQYGYHEALELCRRLWALADRLEATIHGIAGAHGDATVDFLGPVRRSFDAVVQAEIDRMATAAAHARNTAMLLAAQWSQARGQQNRINFARWVEAQKADDNWFERNIWQKVAGETDYGPPPGNPAVPGPGCFPASCTGLYRAYGP